MADSLSRSEIESLLAATKADAALLPQPTHRVDEHVDVESFDHDAIAQNLFVQLAQDTVDSLNRSTRLDLTIAGVQLFESEQGDSSIEVTRRFDEPTWRIDMRDANEDPWSIVFDSSFLFPMIASILGSPIDADETDRTRQELSFIEQRLLRPVFTQIVSDLNATDGDNNTNGRSLRIVDNTNGPVDESQTRMRSAGCRAECRVEGSGFTSRIVFQAPKAVCFGAMLGTDSSPTTGTTVQIEASLATTTISSADIGNLEIGDILMTDIDPESLLVALVDDVPAFRGTMGIFQGRKALLIAEKVAEIR